MRAYLLRLVRLLRNHIEFMMVSDGSQSRFALLHLQAWRRKENLRTCFTSIFGERDRRLQYQTNKEAAAPCRVGVAFLPRHSAIANKHTLPLCHAKEGGFIYDIHTPEHINH